MATAAGVISLISIRDVVDLQKHPRGGFVEMVVFPICAGLFFLAIFAGGSALQTFITVTERSPNQAADEIPGNGPPGKSGRP